MRTQAFGATCAAALMLAACGSEPETTASIEAEPAVPPIAAPVVEVAADGPGVQVAGQLPPPARGGTVVAAGPHPVEVLPHQDGAVHAYIVSAEPPPPDQTQMTVRLAGSDGNTHPVMLVWDPAEQRYAGRLRRVAPAAGPVEVVMLVGPQRYEGRAPTIVILSPPAPVVVEAAAPERPEVVVESPQRPTVVVQRPAPPAVVVERPAPPTIVVQRPAPPAVVVHRPAPPTVVVHRPAAPTVVVQRPAPPAVVVHRPGPPTVVVHHGGPPGHVRVRHDNGRHRGHDRGRGRGRGRD